MLGGLEGPRFLPPTAASPPAGDPRPRLRLERRGPDRARALPRPRPCRGRVRLAQRAPEPVPGYAGGYQWFPLSRLDPHTTAAGVRSAAPHLDRFIDAQLRALRPAGLGLRPGRLQPGDDDGSACGPPAQGAAGRHPWLFGHAGRRRSPARRDRQPAAGLPGARRPRRGDPGPGAVHGRGRPGRRQGPVALADQPGAGHTITEDGLLLGSLSEEAFAGRYGGWAAAVAKSQGV